MLINITLHPVESILNVGSALVEGIARVVVLCQVFATTAKSPMIW
jgi:hypothetical protein